MNPEELSMWMTAYQYNPGYLHWDTQLVQDVRVTREGAVLRVTPQAIPDTTCVHWLLEPGVREELAIECAPSPLVEPDSPIASLEWVRQDGNVETIVWCASEQGMATARLLHVHAFGSSYRLVVDASNLQWGEDRVYRQGADSIRLITGSVSGHGAGPMRYETGTGGVSAVRRVGPETHSGRTIEIVAAGSDHLDARTRCGALLGLLVLTLGPAVLGNVIFESEISAPTHGEFESTLITRFEWQYVLDLPEEAFAVGLGQLPEITRSEKRGAVRALERYAQGVAAQSDELKLAAFFAGIEVIARDFEGQQGGVPWIQARATKHHNAFSRFLDTVGDKYLKSKIMGSLTHVSITNSFDFWKEKNKLDSDEAKRFGDIAKRRNDLFHAGKPGELHDLVEATKRLLYQMLQRELGIAPEAIWNRFPTIQLTAPIDYPNYGWDKGGDPDVAPPIS